MKELKPNRYIMESKQKQVKKKDKSYAMFMHVIVSTGEIVQFRRLGSLLLDSICGHNKHLYIKSNTLAIWVSDQC